MTGLRRSLLAIRSLSSLVALGAGYTPPRQSNGFIYTFTDINGIEYVVAFTDTDGAEYIATGS